MSGVANNVDPDQMPQNVASDHSLRCLLRPVCRNMQINRVLGFLPSLHVKDASVIFCFYQVDRQIGFSLQLYLTNLLK